MARQVGIDETALNDLSAKSFALGVTIRHHVPRYSERFRECRVYPRISVILKVDHGNPVLIERPPERAPESMEQEILGRPFDEQPSPGKKYLTANTTARKREVYLIFGRDKHPARVAEAGNRYAPLCSIRVPMPTVREPLGNRLIKPSVGRDTPSIGVLFEHLAGVSCERCHSVIPGQRGDYATWQE